MRRVRSGSWSTAAGRAWSTWPRRLRDAGHLRADRAVTEAAEALWVLTSFDAFDQLFTGRDLAPGAVAERLTMMAESALLDLA